MPGLTNDQVALYLKDMYKAEREGYKEIATKYNEIFKVVTGVDGAGDKMTQMLGAGRLTRHLTEDQKINFKSPVQGWQFFVKYWTWSDGLSFTKSAIEDTVKLGNLMKDLSKTWGRMVRLEKEDWSSRVFNNGGALLGDIVFDGSHQGNTAPYGKLLYDNFPMFNLTGNARASIAGGTYYNSIASLTLTPANFETLYNLHTTTNNRDERDNVIENTCNTLLTRPGANRFLAERILGTEKGMPFGQLNDINPYYKLLSIIDWDYLSSTENAFYIGTRQSDDFQFHERQDAEVRFWRTEDDLGYKSSINMRGGILIKNFRRWSRGGGTSS